VRDRDLTGRVALVTGGTRGIGAAICHALAADGAAVAAGYSSNQARADELRQSVEAEGGTLSLHQGNIGDAEDCERVVKDVIDQHGRLDILVNNAATNPTFGPLIETESRAVRKVLEVNVEGPLLLAQAAWRAWMSEHGGTIINVVSAGGIRPTPFIGIYNVSKAALIHMTRQLAVELAPKVRVNTIAPGLVKTDFARALWEPNEASAAARHPLQRIGVPDDIAGAALFLASDASSFMTGEMIVLDGGMLLA
jgi:NAD(P)-dependent dehydrogenase (short-subunit alcohol dehydrogenase family)